jgi:hypothetical protein
LVEIIFGTVNHHDEKGMMKPIIRELVPVLLQVVISSGKNHQYGRMVFLLIPFSSAWSKGFFSRYRGYGKPILETPFFEQPFQ